MKRLLILLILFFSSCQHNNNVKSLIDLVPTDPVLIIKNRTDLNNNLINFNNGLKWYQKNYYKKANHKIIADFTPSYFFDLNAPKRIFDTLGSQMKFLVILRNPVDRAYSHYLHSKRDDHENMSFQQALTLEVSRLQKYDEESDYLSYLRHSYVHQGLYSEMLQRYLVYFSLENFLFIEINPRFGGGYPMSHLAGANFPFLIIKEYLMGEKISYINDWSKDSLFLRYDSTFLVKI